MRVLGIDSSTDILSVGLADLQKILGEKTVESQRQHASRIIEAVDEILHDTLVDKSTLTGVAVAIGPGSFTGLRVGLAAAKGMAVALGLPIVGVSTLEIVGKRLENDYSEFCLMSMARKGEYYFTKYKPNVKLSELITVVESQNLHGMVGGLPWAIVGRAEDNVGLPLDNIISPERTRVSGGELALRGARLIKAGHSDEVDSLVPLYVAPSQAERKYNVRKSHHSGND